MESAPALGNRKITFLALIILSGAVFFLPFLGSAHLFDWDEINFAEAAREMIVTGDYSKVQIDYKPFREKPPLFFWLQAASMNVLGVNEYAARLPNAIAGIATLIALFLIGRKWKGDAFGLVWSLTYLSMMIPFVYFKSGVIDPVFNLFIFLSIYFLSRFEAGQPGERIKFAALSGLMCGLATLTKGPVALLLLILTWVVYLTVTKRWGSLKLNTILTFAACYAVVSSAWIAIELLENGPWFLVEFIRYQLELLTKPVAGHGQPIYYHFLVILVGCFPASIFALPVLMQRRTADGTALLRWMKILFWVVMILFSLVQTKIVHYSSQAYFPLSFMAAIYIYRVLVDRPARWVIVVIGVLGVVVGSAITIVPLLPGYLDQLAPYIKDTFAQACLRTPVSWSGYEGIIGVLFLAAVGTSVYLLFTRRTVPGLIVLCYGICFSLLLGLKFILPKIEQYSQGPEIAFFQELRSRDCYVKAVGYWSYAPFFYAEKMPDSPDTDDVEWLFQGKIDKPAYFVCKISQRDELLSYPNVTLIREMGGYLLFERKPGIPVSDE